MANTTRASFGSKLGIILATAGSAVGLGNIWRFPYMTGSNGGAAFIFIYIACVLVLGIPCMVSEFIIGRRGAANAARAYGRVGKNPMWRLVGFLGVLAGFLIAGYYAVVSGWCLEYVYGSVVSNIGDGKDAIHSYFNTFVHDPVRPVFWAVLFLLISHFVIIRGVRNGIEKASKVLMPTLFILLLVLVVSSCLLPGADKGISFLFYPEFDKVDGNVFLSALGQSFYSLSLAMGAICTYASYFSRDTRLTKSAVQISVIDCLVAILAGMMIFPAAFSVGVNPDSGPSLLFVTLPNVFQQAFSPAVGYVVSLMFYALLSLAALTSLISLHEVSTAFLEEEMHFSRTKAAWVITGCFAVVATLCSLSLGNFEGLSIFGLPLFDLLDFLTAQILLPVGGFLTCIFLGWFVPKQTVRDELTNGGTLRGTFFAVYLFLIRFVCPLCILAVFLHQFGVFHWVGFL